MLYVSSLPQFQLLSTRAFLSSQVVRRKTFVMIPQSSVFRGFCFHSWTSKIYISREFFSIKFGQSLFNLCFVRGIIALPSSHGTPTFSLIQFFEAAF